AAEPLTGRVDLPLGLRSSTTYHKRRLEMADGDLLLLAGEEVTAARSPWDEAFGAGALDEALAAAAVEGPDAVVDRAMDELLRFVGRRRPVGDLTLIAVQQQTDAGRNPLL